MFSGRADTSTIRRLFDFTPLKPQAAKHLRNVYALLAVGLLVSTCGALFDMYVYQVGGILTAIGSVVACIFAGQHRQSTTPYTTTSLAAFLTFAALKGLTLGQLIHKVSVNVRLECQTGTINVIVIVSYVLY